ncbi:MAG: MJ0042-type zinc finger domain-containing protein, partial [Gammaproteobacteria bacterium]
MYTQCPECDVAFRVTAEVLRQAAGKVRCGGCGAAFNALNHLSEHEPAAQAPAEPDPEPQLTPDPPGDLEADTPPKSISAEQSAALLKTLDELAGSDIRIEDTGVEWRVLDEDAGEGPADMAPVEETPADESSVEAMLEGSFKPIDEVITESADSDDGPEVIEEMRFDDDTPLPEDFDFESASPAAPAVVTEPEPPPPDPAEAQVDLAFGDPNEWQELLGDLDEPAEPAAEEPEQAEIDEGDAEPAITAEADSPEEPEAEPEVLAEAPAGLETAVEGADIDDAAFEQPPDMDTQFAIQAEAMGIDLSGLHATKDDEAEEAEETEEAEEEVVEVDAETSIEEDLIAAAFESEATARNKAIEGHSLDPAEIAKLEALELEALEAAEKLDEEPESDEPKEVSVAQEDEEPIELEEALAATEDEEPIELEEAPSATGDEESIELAEAPDATEDEESIEFELHEEFALEDEPDRKGDVDEIARFFDDKVERAIETMSASFDDGATESDVEDASDEHVMPEMSEEEKTINMMIDQELFNIAVEDEDGFASTIVQLQPNKDVEEELEENQK